MVGFHFLFIPWFLGCNSYRYRALGFGNGIGLGDDKKMEMN